MYKTLNSIIIAMVAGATVASAVTYSGDRIFKDGIRLEPYSDGYADHLGYEFVYEMPDEDTNGKLYLNPTAYSKTNLSRGMVIDGANGSMGIGMQSSSSYRLSVNGDVSVVGAISAENLFASSIVPPTSVVGPAEVGVGEFAVIDQNVTYSVGGSGDDFSSIHAALDWLDLKVISKDAIVTLDLSDATYSNLDAIEVNHPYGRQIHIVGNESSPSSVILSFKFGENGIFITDGSTLGRLAGVTLEGSSSSSSTVNPAGVLLTKCSTIDTMDDVVIEDFEVGVLAAWASHATCAVGGVTVSGSTDAAFKAFGSSSIKADSCTVTSVVSPGKHAIATANSFISFLGGSSSNSVINDSSHINY